MKTMKWLIRREFFEHRGMFIKAPVIVGLLIVLLVGIGVVSGVGESHQGNDSYDLLPGSEKVRLILNTAYMASFAPLFLMQSVVLFFYSLSTLHSERTDRSILFWKSLPISDSMTVISKLITALICVPLITLVVTTITSLLLILIMCVTLAFKGFNLFSIVFFTSTVYSTPLQVLAILPVYIIWALPTIGWLFMVSGWARSKVFLWAVGVPLLTMTILKIITTAYRLNWDVDWLGSHVILRSVDGLFPGIWNAFNQIGAEPLMNEHQALDSGMVLKTAWWSLTAINAWAGALCGAAMLGVAIRMRRWREDD